MRCSSRENGWLVSDRQLWGYAAGGERESPGSGMVLIPFHSSFLGVRLLPVKVQVGPGAAYLRARIRVV
ncbi:hypothetical protein DC3_46550 [Deinococcus cellulosilyticus NBRC 106333 = KACC 11606]|uniref:Uncharacterized protein n=1 Tax=Deinococcus cellulosilyticus (strain DSM 18568 / NBRC 106333 / KACC 11606 / 5516J-15) TaxID=1223518 RepID=A0A511N872_DEIC1|nr:hypothetical protein DC3_46550 [Deinococcus cellulosilyticus NBRC 106333 = KACC 11606]